MITACTNDQRLLPQSNKAQPKDKSALKEQLESNHFPSVFNTKYIAVAFQQKESFSAVIFSLRPGGFPQSWLRGRKEETRTEIPKNDTVC